MVKAAQVRILLSALFFRLTFPLGTCAGMHIFLFLLYSVSCNATLADLQQQSVSKSLCMLLSCTAAFLSTSLLLKHPPFTHSAIALIPHCSASYGHRWSSGV